MVSRLPLHPGSLYLGSQVMLVILQPHTPAGTPPSSKHRLRAEGACTHHDSQLVFAWQPKLLCWKCTDTRTVILGEAYDPGAGT